MVQHEPCVDLTSGCQDYIDRCDLFRHQAFTTQWCPATCRVCSPTIPHFSSTCDDLAANCAQLDCSLPVIKDKYCRKTCATCDFDLSSLFQTAKCPEHRLCYQLEHYSDANRRIICQNARIRALCPSSCGFCSFNSAKEDANADCDDLFPIYCAMTITSQHRHMCNHPRAYQKCGKTCDKCHLTRHLTKRCEDLNTACVDMRQRCHEGWVGEVCPKTCSLCAAD